MWSSNVLQHPCKTGRRRKVGGSHVSDIVYKDEAVSDRTREDLLEYVSRRCQNIRTSSYLTAAGGDEPEGSRDHSTGAPVHALLGGSLLSVKSSTSPVSRTTPLVVVEAMETSTYGTLRGTESGYRRSTRVSAAVASKYLQTQVRSVVAQLYNPSSAAHYDRHVLLLDELLQGDAALGFTPSMVLSGVVDMLYFFSQALRKGELHVSPLSATAGGASLPGSHTAASRPLPFDADFQKCAQWAAPANVERFLPSLIKQATMPQKEGDKSTLVRALHEEAQKRQRWPSSFDHVADRVPSYITHTREDGEKTSYSVNPLLSAVGDAPDALEMERQQRLATLPDALYALLLHCSKPLICLTLEDQGKTAEAVMQLCDALAHIVGQLPSNGQPWDASSVLGENNNSSPVESGGHSYLQFTEGRVVDSALAKMTSVLRRAALHSMESLLALYYSGMQPFAGKSLVEGANVPGRTPTVSGGALGSTYLSSTRKAIVLDTTGAADFLVQLWATLLQDSATGDVRGLRDGNTLPSQPTTKLLDSARNVNPQRVDIRDTISTDSSDSDGLPEGTIPSHDKVVTGDSKSLNSTTSATAATGELPDRKVNDSRNLMDAAEEDEVGTILRILQHIISVSSTGSEGSGLAASTYEDNHLPCQKEVPLHPHIPVLTVRTLARCAPGDYCASLSLDLLWLMMRIAPSAVTHAILYDVRPCFPSIAKDTACAASNYTRLEASASENLFQILVDQLSSVHFTRQREMRNDVVVLTTLLLRQHTTELNLVLASPMCSSTPTETTGHVGESPKCNDLTFPLPITTIDALNAITLVLFDILCGNELSLPTGDAGVLISISSEDTRRADSASGGALLISEQLRRLQKFRFQGAASSTSRKENLQFKRLGWQLLVAFCEWQTCYNFHEEQRYRLERASWMKSRSMSPSLPSGVNAEEGGVGAPSPPYEGCYLVDLCRLGFIDVLLMYVDTNCTDPVVVSWMHEEQVTLQAECWQLLTSLVATAQRFRLREGVSCQYHHSSRGSVGERLAEPAKTPQESSSPLHLDAVNEIIVEITDSEVADRHTASFSVERGTEATTVDIDVSMSPSCDELHPHSHTGFSLAGRYGEESHAAADLQFIAAGGMECTLRYIREAPTSVESLKRSALVLLSTTSRDPLVRHHLARQPGLVTLLVSALKLVLGASSNSVNASSDGSAEEYTPNQESRFFLSAPSLEFALECFDLLQNVGAIATHNTIAETHGKVSSVIGTESSNELCAHLLRSPMHESESLRGSQDIESLRNEFTEANGVGLLVDWLEHALLPDAAHAAAVSANASLTVSDWKRRAPCVGGTLGPERISTLVPPLCENVLVYHLDLILVILNCVGALILGNTECERQFVQLNGTHLLLQTVEAMGLASHSFSTKYAFTENPAVFIPHLGALQEMAEGGQETQVAADRRREEFSNALQYALSLLADLLRECKEARLAFSLWHSTRLEKNVPPFEPKREADSHFLSATQMLLALCEVPIAGPDMHSRLGADVGNCCRCSEEAVGLDLLHVHVRDIIRVDLIREYVRQLLRRRYERMQDHSDATGGNVFREEWERDVRAYSSLLLGVQDDTGYISEVAQSTDVELFVESVREALSMSNEDVQLIQALAMEDLLRQKMGLPVKVHCCLSAVGLDELLGASLDPLERANLICVAALPALCLDELCVAMAESAGISLGTASNPGGSPGCHTDRADGNATLGVRGVPSIEANDANHRCLSGALVDIRSRSQELHQLLYLGASGKSLQHKQLYDRFLVTRFREALDDQLGGGWTHMTSRRHVHCRTVNRLQGRGKHSNAKLGGMFWHLHSSGSGGISRGGCGLDTSGIPDRRAPLGDAHSALPTNGLRGGEIGEQSPPRHLAASLGHKLSQEQREEERNELCRSYGSCRAMKSTLKESENYNAERHTMLDRVFDNLASHFLKDASAVLGGMTTADRCEGRTEAGPDTDGICENGTAFSAAVRSEHRQQVISHESVRPVVGLAERRRKKAQMIKCSLRQLPEVQHPAGSSDTL